MLRKFSKGGKVDLPLPDLHDLLLTLALIVLVRVLVGVLARKRFPGLRAMLDCYSGQSTRGVPGGRVSGWGSQDQELDGNTKTQ